MRTFNFRLFSTHLLVALVATTGILVLTVLVQLAQGRSGADPALYVQAQQIIVNWQTDAHNLELSGVTAYDLPAGFGLVLDAAGRVRYHQGDTSCEIDMAAAACAPTIQSLTPGIHPLPAELAPTSSLGAQWFEVVLPLAEGGVVVAHLPNLGLADVRVSALGVTIRGLWEGIGFMVLVGTLLTIPPALLMTWFLVRPLTRRLGRITETSRRFADGDMQARTLDTGDDEVGQLARQVDDMADTLAQNIGVLRDLAQQNAALTRRAEEGAIQAERLRLARDLHDEIAQQLFSVALTAASLPDQIRRDPAQAVTQAETLANLAEQTQMDLRTILVELRPAHVTRQGLSEALQELCTQWQQVHKLPVDLAIMLTGRYLPAGVEDVIYRVAREALSNVAKHAQASSVSLTLVEGQQQITLSVTDDGIGFDPAQAGRPGHYGLTTFRERAQALGGNVVIESDTARGTTVRLTLPLEVPA